MGVALVPMIIMAVAATAKATADIREGEFKAAVSRRNARAAAKAAGAARLEGDMEMQKIALKASAIEGAARAKMGKSGALDLSLGSPLELVADSALMAKHQENVTSNNVTRRALGYEDQASQFQTQAELDQSSGYWSAGADVLQGAAGMVSMGSSVNLFGGGDGALDITS